MLPNLHMSNDARGKSHDSAETATGSGDHVEAKSAVAQVEASQVPVKPGASHVQAMIAAFDPQGQQMQLQSGNVLCLQCPSKVSSCFC